MLLLLNQILVWDILIPDSKQDIKIAQQKTDDLKVKYMASLVMAKPSTFENVWTQYTKEMKSANYNIGDEYTTQQIQLRIKNWK